MSYILFLDDERMPHQVTWMSVKYNNSNWLIVRNYDDFVQAIEKSGLPVLISFDHDLATDHYVPENLWDDYDASKKYQENIQSEEKTGYDCAKWLVEYCKKHKLQLPAYIVHSMNPVGRNNIIGLLNFYKERFSYE